MKIVVTGGLGFIGGTLVEELVKRNKNAEIIVVDAETYSADRRNVKNVEDKIEIVKADVAVDDAAVDTAIKGADVVYHLAAESHVDTSISAPLRFQSSNYMGTFKVLEAVRKFEVSRLVYTSTSESYGTALTVPMTEDHPINPMSPYAAAKAGGDRLAYSYFCTFKTPVVIARPFNNYGPRQYPEKLIPTVILRCIKFSDMKIPLYGDGTATRDWILVNDNVDGLITLGSAPEDKVVGQVFNIASGKDYSGLYIARYICEFFGLDPDEKIRFVRDRPGHVMRHIAGTDKMEKVLGWTNSVPFEEGLKKTCEWYRDNEWWWEPKLGAVSNRDV